MKLLTVENSQLEVRPPGSVNTSAGSSSLRMPGSDDSLVCIHRLRTALRIHSRCACRADRVVDDGIADEEPAADQEGDSENSQRFDKNFFCRFPEMNHQREEQQNAAQQVRVGVIVRQRAESAACSQADTVFFAECAFHAANPEIDDQCDRENGERVVVHIAGEEHKLRQKTDENTAEQCGFAPFKELFADQKHNDQCAGAGKDAGEASGS